ncbi:hypothetical protein [Methylocystis sp. SC2]|uniref:hypothetical protein n=1 Tax=Methylocystis sp. (strain SC2) TaxID=187303 RepID=UPI00027AE88C|nr:hypothetical protein [Methylocystis sp. SC2]CCJ07930.1 Hypothetical protein BN69_2479 [Methylocystis sp. SC2]
MVLAIYDVAILRRQANNLGFQSIAADADSAQIVNSMQSRGSRGRHDRQRQNRSGNFATVDEAVGGSISLGESQLKSVEVSKSGDRLTIVLKKKKQKKGADQAQP